ncbi:MAG: SDR family oxidoreductase [Methylophaga sp.]|nr:SDR family oxidoreductase [Methylophaga sp.]
MKKILLTGATGFIGQALAHELLSQGYGLVAAVRQQSDKLSEEITQIIVGDINASTDWTEALHNVDMVIHLAARAHILNDYSDDALAEYRKVNVEGTLALARQAEMLGINRFIFLSSIGVNGNKSQSPFTEKDSADPQEFYAQSKLEAEQGLWRLEADTSLSVVIIRPPLVYGSSPPGNFKTLLRWVQMGIPLPLGAIDNQRSFVALDNLVSFIIHCIDHPKAANEIFLISDGEDVSTTELLQKVAEAFGKKVFLLPVPLELMRFFAKLLGKEDVAERLFGSLQVDSSKARDLLGWKPVITMDEQLKKITTVLSRKENT